MLDPWVAAMLWAGRRTGRAFRPGIAVDELRASYAEANRRLGPRGARGVRVEKHAIDAAGRTIPSRLYRPDDAGGDAPLLVFFHGGGFCIGDVASYDGLTRFFAREGRLVVLSVEYRLAPESPFPAAYDDAFAALAWAQRNAAAIGSDPARIAVGGDSAGGALAAALGAYAEASGIARPAFALLIYPAVAAVHDFPSARRYRRNLPLTPEVIDWFAQRFLRDPNDARDPRIALLDAPDLTRFPPTYLQAAQYDPLLDEGAAYAERLRAAGVDVTYDVRRTLPHGYVNIAGAVPAARRALRDAIVATSQALAKPPATIRC